MATPIIVVDDDPIVGTLTLELIQEAGFTAILVQDSLKAQDISWGNALANAQSVQVNGNWWWAFFPGMAIALTVISINFMGDGLRDALDPRSRE